MHLFATTTAEQALELGKAAAVVEVARKVSSGEAKAAGTGKD
jgi:hypothetical protein